MTDLQARELVAMLLGAFPAARITEHTPAVYRMAIRDLDFARADVAVRRLLMTSRFIPTIAEIREAVVEVEHGDQRNGAEAWGDVLHAVGRFGRDRGDEATRWLAARDPLLPDAVDAVGWRAICNAEETDAAPRAKFADAYNSIARSGRRAIQTSHGATGQLRGRSRDNKELSAGELIARMIPSETKQGGE